MLEVKDINQFYGNAANTNGVDWNQNGTLTVSTLKSGYVSGANNGGGDSGLLLGDLNHSGAVHAGELFLDLTVAQALMGISTW